MSEHTQVGPYALGLLDPLEMSRFEEHLAECDECATQLEWMLPVADFMADVEPGDLFGIEGPSAFSAPGGSVQQSLTSEPPTRQAPQAPAAPTNAQLRDLNAPRYPQEFSPSTGSWAHENPPVDPRTGEVARVDPRTGEVARVDPRTGSVPRVDPRTGSIPRVDPHTGSVPRVDPRTGSIPRVDPRTGSIPRVDPRTGSIPRVDPRTGSIPRVDPHTGSIPRVASHRTGEVPIDPVTGENRIVPLVRGGESSRRRSQSRSVSHRPAATSDLSERRPGLLLAAAAAILVLGAAAGAGAVTAGPWANNSSGSAQADGGNGGLDSPTATKLAATDAQTGVHADIALDSKPWGTLVSYSVSELDGPRKCRLVAVLEDGKTEVLSTWTVPEQGYSEGTVPPKLALEAATAVTRRDIAALRVQDISQEGDATTLVTIRS